MSRYNTTYIPATVGSAETGEIRIWAGGSSDIPEGYLLCDGSAVSRTQYTALYALIGDTYGAGDGSTTFNVPDLREAFPMGASTAKPIGTTGGEAAHVLTVDELPAHDHSLPLATGGSQNDRVGKGSTGTLTSITTNSTGGGEAHNNLPPYVCINYIIKT